MRNRITGLVVGVSLSLLTMGALRMATTQPGALTPLAGLVGVVVVFTLALVRAGLPLNQFGFGVRLGARHILLAIARLSAASSLQARTERHAADAASQGGPATGTELRD